MTVVSTRDVIRPRWMVRCATCGFAGDSEAPTSADAIAVYAAHPHALTATAYPPRPPSVADLAERVKELADAVQALTLRVAALEHDEAPPPSAAGVVVVPS
jgi:hypothetical protein